MNKRKILIGILITISSVAFLSFICLAILVDRHFLFAIDNNTINIVLDIRNNGLTILAKIITNLGSAIFIIVSSMLVMVLVRRWRDRIFFATTLGVGAILSAIMKVLVSRIRPADIALIVEESFSFPSGHAMLSFIFYGLLIYLVCKFLSNKPLKVSLSILFGLVAVAVALTRVYLGVHFMTDLIGGWLLGGAVLVAGILVYEFVLCEVKATKK